MSSAAQGQRETRRERDARYDEMLAERRGPHAVGKPCPYQPWMLVTTLDIDRGRCGACGHGLGGQHHVPQENEGLTVEQRLTRLETWAEDTARWSDGIVAALDGLTGRGFKVRRRG